MCKMPILFGFSFTRLLVIDMVRQGENAENVVLFFARGEVKYSNITGAEAQILRSDEQECAKKSKSSKMRELCVYLKKMRLLLSIVLRSE